MRPAIVLLALLMLTAGVPSATAPPGAITAAEPDNSGSAGEGMAGDLGSTHAAGIAPAEGRLLGGAGGNPSNGKAPPQPPALPLPQPRAAAPVLGEAAPAREAQPLGALPPRVEPTPAPRIIGPAAPLTYSACGHVAGGEVHCAGPFPFGTPIQLDIDDRRGMDVQATVLPVPLPQVPTEPEGLVAAAAGLVSDPLGIVDQVAGLAGDLTQPGVGVVIRIEAIQVEVPCTYHVNLDVEVGPAEHLDASCRITYPDTGVGVGARALPARVWVSYAVPGDTSQELRLGVDGRADKMPEATTMVLHLDDLGALPEQARLTLNATFDQPGDEATLFAELGDPSGAGPLVDPTFVGIRLEPVVALGIHVDAQLDGTHILGVLDPAAPMLATLIFEDTDALTHTLATVALDQLPPHAQAEFTRFADGARVRYDAAAPIDLVTANFDRSEPDTRLSGQVVVEDLPSAVLVEVRPADRHGSVHYEASAEVPKVEAHVELADGTTDIILDATVHNLPSELDTSYDTQAHPRTVIYDASDTLGPVSLAMAQGDERLSVEVTSIPPYIALTFDEEYAVFDGRTSPEAAQGSAALGTVTVRYRSLGAAFATLPAEDHLVLGPADPPGADGGIRLAVQHTGLKLASADLRGEELHVEVRNADARPFVFDMETGEVAARGRIADVPEEVRVDMVPEGSEAGFLTYDASSPIGSITADLVLRTGTVPVAASGEVQDLPDALSAAYDFRNITLPSGEEEERQHVAWHASEQVPFASLRACVGAEVVEPCPGLALVAQVRELPGDLTADASPESVAWHGDAVVGAALVHLQHPTSIGESGFVEVFVNATEFPSQGEIFLDPNNTRLILPAEPLTGMVRATKGIDLTDVPADIHVLVRTGFNGTLLGLLARVEGLQGAQYCKICGGDELLLSVQTTGRPSAIVTIDEPTPESVALHKADPTVLPELWTKVAVDVAALPDSATLHVSNGTSEFVSCVGAREIPTPCSDPFLASSIFSRDHKVTSTHIRYNATHPADLNQFLLRLDGGKEFTVEADEAGVGAAIDLIKISNSVCDTDPWPADDEISDYLLMGLRLDGHFSVPRFSLTDADSYLDVAGAVADDLQFGFAKCLDSDCFAGCIEHGPQGVVLLQGKGGGAVFEAFVGSFDDDGLREEAEVHMRACTDDQGRPWTGSFLISIDDLGLLGLLDVTLNLVAKIVTLWQAESFLVFSDPLDTGDNAITGEFGIVVKGPADNDPGCGLS